MLQLYIEGPQLSMEDGKIAASIIIASGHISNHNIKQGTRQ